MTCCARFTSLLVFFFASILSLYSDDINITSAQQIISEDSYTFYDNVSLKIADKYHIIADSVIYDVQQQKFTSHANTPLGIKIETPRYLIYAQQFCYDKNQAQLSFDGATIHLSKGYVAAKHVHQTESHDWLLYDALYTPCDAYEPHWKINAKKAYLYESRVDAYNALLTIRRCPVAYMPRFIAPLQGRAQSGFLMPKLSFYSRSGFGVAQDYYWYLSPNADYTIGVDWQHDRGLFVTFNNRWANSPHEYSFTKGYVGRAWNMFVQRGDEITKTSRNRYWLQNESFAFFDSIGCFQTRLLAQADYGTDKRIGYQFLDTVADVDDTFLNSAIIRCYNDQQAVDFRVNAIETKRHRFSDLSEQDYSLIKHVLTAIDKQDTIDVQLLDSAQNKDLESRFFVMHLPAVEYSGSYNFYNDIFSYRHDITADYVSFREYETEKIYALTMLALEDPLVPKFGNELLRLDYRGVIREHFYLLDQSITLFAVPRYQIRSQVPDPVNQKLRSLQYKFAANGQQRLFCEFGIEWALPEITNSTFTESFTYYMQPVVSWDFLPASYDKNWYVVDKWDVVYPKNEIQYSLRNNIIVGNMRCDWSITQAYDFYANKKLFPLRRTLSEKHFLPLKSFVAIASDALAFTQEIEFDVSAKRLLASEFGIKTIIGPIEITLNYLYENLRLQEQRRLLSNISHFLFLNSTLALNRHASLEYGGYFSCEQGVFDYKPLIHQVRFKYSGHCWGFYLGFEEKIYRESGMPRREQLAVFSLYFDSLGSVGKKIKSPYS